jgi:rhodanese-related sulfurtransferase
MRLFANLGLFNKMKRRRKTAAEVRKAMQAAGSCVILDVRTPEEYRAGHIVGAVLMPVNIVAAKAARVLPDKAVPVYVYCHSGRRAARAQSILERLGYTEVYNFGGIINWPYEITQEGI